ncbi:hypothetical protein SARC_11529 [Sphaeroforma arctica JP610]|uniref:Uncharacterized protein n=1 Tax=Sphaeroforma arctica JP610 TaxID=667725 RepID=A0A0L0FGQ5_9EUKA|nr:hypothetical protein SARC_11529 [Sphaeroforma arctica JP610]KNC75957.1 hypothetical protein SARC_11529 [Sphaeroforma arctica JP610]|eukprot:XP_014149859.1 hypothetical protein SARC_11529 [Sphaeroforma arctica JP610]
MWGPGYNNGVIFPGYALFLSCFRQVKIFSLCHYHTRMANSALTPLPQVHRDSPVTEPNSVYDERLYQRSADPVSELMELMSANIEKNAPDAPEQSEKSASSAENASPSGDQNSPDHQSPDETNGGPTTADNPAETAAPHLGRNQQPQVDNTAAGASPAAP